MFAKPQMHSPSGWPDADRARYPILGYTLSTDSGPSPVRSQQVFAETGPGGPGAIIWIRLGLPVRAPRPVSRGAGLTKFAGKAKGLPADASRNLEHYSYGHRKR